MTSGAVPPATAADEAALHRRGLLLVAGSAVIYSFGGLLQRWIGIEDAWTVILWRSVFAALFLLAFIAWRDGRAAPGLFRRMGAPGLVIVACFVVASVTFVLALALTSVANVLFIFSTAPLLAAGLGRLVLGERVRTATWLALCAGLAGVGIMVSDSLGRGALAGDALAAAVALAIAVAIVTVRRHRDVRMTPSVCVAMVVTALIALPLAGTVVVTERDFALLLLFGAGQLGVGLALFTAGARLAPAVEVGFLTVLEPVLGPVWVWLALGEEPGAPTLMGGAVVLAALLVHGALDLRRGRLPPPI